MTNETVLRNKCTVITWGDQDSQLDLVEHLIERSDAIQNLLWHCDHIDNIYCFSMCYLAIVALELCAKTDAHGLKIIRLFKEAGFL